MFQPRTALLVTSLVMVCLSCPAQHTSARMYLQAAVIVSALTIALYCTCTCWPYSLRVSQLVMVVADSAQALQG